MAETLLVSLWLFWSPVLAEAAHHAADLGHALQAAALHVSVCLARP